MLAAVARDLWTEEVGWGMLEGLCGEEVTAAEVRAVWVSKLTNGIKAIRREHQLRLGLLERRE